MKAFAPNFAIDFSIRVLFFAVLWVLINEWDPGSWWVGAPVVCAAAGLSHALRHRSAWRIRWKALPSFLFFFACRSFSGGLEVALRVLRPRMRIDPGLVPFTTTLPEGPSRNFFVIVISLLPGTLSAGIEGDRIIVHSMAVNEAMDSGLRELEMMVAGLFGHGKGVET